MNIINFGAWNHLQRVALRRCKGVRANVLSDSSEREQMGLEFSEASIRMSNEFNSSNVSSHCVFLARKTEKKCQFLEKPKWL